MADAVYTPFPKTGDKSLPKPQIGVLRKNGNSYEQWNGARWVAQDMSQARPGRTAGPDAQPASYAGINSAISKRK
jgi:hypothetical protein